MSIGINNFYFYNEFSQFLLKIILVLGISSANTL